MNAYQIEQIAFEKEMEIRRNANNPALDAIKDALLTAPKPEKKDLLAVIQSIFRKPPPQQQPCETC
jgi:hypothetical protein